MTTILIPVAAIPTNPETWILEETLKSVRYHFPDDRIILTYDYPQKEYRHLLNNYIEFKARMTEKIRKEFDNILEIDFKEHQHQTGTFMEARKHMDSDDLLIYVEQDTPLIEKPIPWNQFSDLILFGHADSIQLAHTTKIPDEHWHMMLDKEPVLVKGVPLIRTYQWSQRPHISSVEFYDKLFAEHVHGQVGWYIEHIVYGPIVSEYLKNGWGKYKIYNYIPDDPNIQRSTHLDGRKRLS